MTDMPKPVFVLLALIAALVPATGWSDSLAQGYRLVPGDLISIQVFGESDLSVEVRITERGVISYPFLGEIRLEGLSSAEVEERVAEGLRAGYLVDPRVNVAILEYRPVYVNGAVSQPNSIPYTPGLTVRKALSMAGGLTERASDNKIYIVSAADPTSTPLKASLDSPVRPGDTISVGESFF